MKPDQLLAWVLSVAVSILVISVTFFFLSDFYAGNFNRFDQVSERWLRLAPPLFGFATIAVSAFVATYVVRHFRSSSGEMEMSVLGVKLRGPSSQLLLWIVAFLAVSAVMAVILRPLQPNI